MRRSLLAFWIIAFGFAAQAQATVLDITLQPTQFITNIYVYDPEGGTLPGNTFQYDISTGLITAPNFVTTAGRVLPGAVYPGGAGYGASLFFAASLAPLLSGILPQDESLLLIYANGGSGNARTAVISEIRCPIAQCYLTLSSLGFLEAFSDSALAVPVDAPIRYAPGRFTFTFPVPEPDGLALAGVALLALVLLRRRIV